MSCRISLKMTLVLMQLDEHYTLSNEPPSGSRCLRVQGEILGTSPCRDLFDFFVQRGVKVKALTATKT